MVLEHVLLVNHKWYVCFPARLLMIDLSPPFSTDVGQDVCEALENMFSLACNLSGPTRIPFFGVMALYNYPEVTPTMKIEPRHEISNDVVCATSKASDQPAHTCSLIRTFACRLSIP